MATSTPYVILWTGGKAVAKSIYVPNEPKLKIGLEIYGGLNIKSKLPGLGVRAKDKRFPEEGGTILFCHQLGYFDPFSTYRGMLIASRLPRIDETSFHKAMPSTKRRFHPADERVQQDVIDLVGQKIFDCIMKRIPENLESALKVAKQHQCIIDARAFNWEIEAGTISYMPWFKQYGILTQEEFQKRGIEQEEILRRFDDHIQAFVAQNKSYEVYTSKIEQEVLNCHRAGLTDEVEITGLSIYIALWNAAVEVHACTEDIQDQNAHSVRRDILVCVGQYMVEHFKQGSVEEWAIRLVTTGAKLTERMRAKRN